MALARILGIADRLLDESKDWLWLGGRMPDMGDRVSANEAFLDRYEARLPELLGPEDALRYPKKLRSRPAHRHTRARRVSRRFSLLLLALVAATGLLATPLGSAEVRAAAPDLTIVGNARYDVQPQAKRIRVTVDLTMTNHLHDTKTKRYYFDRAFLSVLPDALVSS